MKKYILTLTAAAAMLTGCYNDFSDVEPAVRYGDASFAEKFPDCTPISIADLKNNIYAPACTFTYVLNGEEKILSFPADPNYEMGENSSWENTKFVHITDDVYIKGKVISSDEEGNIYKSLYLQDETGAIEVRLSLGNYMKYHLGSYDPAILDSAEFDADPSVLTIPSMWVYVRLKDLYIGNYRMMLSIGAGPTDSFNKRDEHKYYANSAISNRDVIAQHVFAGEDATLKGGFDGTKEGGDIMIITKDNYASINGQAHKDLLGRLMLFKDITCTYSGVMDQNGVKAAAIGDNIYPSWLYTENMNYSNGILTKPWYRWAYTVDSKSLYGSVLFSYLADIPSTAIVAGAYSVRTSGYSTFANKPIVRNGAVGSILAIYGVYSKSWTYSYGAYQLAVSNYQDIHFAAEDYLSEEQVAAMTPDGGKGMYYITTTDGAKRLVYNAETDGFALADADEIEQIDARYPYIYTGVENIDNLNSDDKKLNFIAYSSFSTFTNAIVFEVGDETLMLDVSGNAFATTPVVITDGKFDYNQAGGLQFTASNGRYAIKSIAGKYLAQSGDALTLSDTAYWWNITVPATDYDKEKNSYYVSWVDGETDDDGTSGE